MRDWLSGRRRGRVNATDEAVRAARRLIPDPWDVEKFVQAVADQRGQPIEIAEADLSHLDDASGVWLGYPTHDVILHRPNVTPAQREAIICHEIGHMMCGHESLVGLHRSRYDDDRELEAETFSARMLVHTRSSADDATRGHLPGRLR